MSVEEDEAVVRRGIAEATTGGDEAVAGGAVGDLPGPPGRPAAEPR